MTRKIVDTSKLRNIIESEFSDIVSDVQEPFINELKIRIIDDSFVKI